MLLNLGCGADIRKDWINHDKVRHTKHIHAHDLNIIPWPWDANSASRIDAISVFEHLEIDLITSLNECWRILEHGGTLHIKYPLYNSPFIHDDPTHRWHWSEAVTDFVVPSTKYGKSCIFYTPFKWRILERHCSARNCWVAMIPEGK